MRTITALLLVTVVIASMLGGCGPLVQRVEPDESVPEPPPVPVDSPEEEPAPLACRAEPVRIAAWSSEGIGISDHIDVVGAHNRANLICHARRGTVKIVGERGATYYPPTRAQDADLSITEDVVEITVETEDGRRAQCNMLISIYDPTRPPEGPAGPTGRVEPPEEIEPYDHEPPAVEEDDEDGDEYPV
jgi:hypothetical protein